MLTLLRRAGFRLWYEAWTWLSRQFRDRSVAIHGAIDTPYPGQPYMQSLHVRGWLVSSEPWPLELELSLGRSRLATLSLAGDRSPATSRHDFSALIEPRALSGMGTGLLKVLVRTPQGKRTIIALTPVRRVMRVPSRLARSEYGRVWDSVSSTWKEARVSVAGYSDDAEWQRSGQSTAEYVVRSLGIGPSDRVLEIGCGTGRVGRFVARQCRQWIGSDVSRNMIAFAKQELSGEPNVDWVLLNGYDLGSIESECVDAVYCSAVFMHIDEWDRYRYVKEALRVLRPGGRAFFDNYSLLGGAGWRFFEETSQLDIAVRPPNVSRSSTPQELRQYLERAGFVAIRVEEGDMFVTALGNKPTAS